jgi:hypothetical protein
MSDRPLTYQNPHDSTARPSHEVFGIKPPAGERPDFRTGAQIQHQPLDIAVPLGLEQRRHRSADEVNEIKARLAATAAAGASPQAVDVAALLARVEALEASYAQLSAAVYAQPTGSGS